MNTKLTGIEKIVLLLSIVLIIIVCGVGYIKSLDKKEPYKSQIIDYKPNNKKLSLKHKEFTLKQNGRLDQDASTYFTGTSEQLKKVNLNFDDVDMHTVGTYEVSATDGKKTYTFTIKVEESNNPTITAQRESFDYIIGPYSTIEEVQSIISATAKDINGNNLSVDIEGYPTTFPNEMGKHSYQLQVSDTQQNTGYLEIVINFRSL